MIPYQEIVFSPHIGVAKLRLKLVCEQVFEHLVALALRQLVDPHNKARIAVKYLAAGYRMREEDGMYNRRAAATLLVGGVGAQIG